MTDLDGVIRHWDNKALFKFERDNGLEEGFLFSHAFKEAFLDPAIKGEVSHEVWLENVAMSLKNNNEAGDRHVSLVHELLGQWQKSPFELNLALFDECQNIFPGTPVVLATNATTRLTDDISNTGLPERLNRIFNSSDIGNAKPDLAFFEYALTELHCAPDEVAFIDDQTENVDAAKILGIHSFLFTSLSALSAELINLRSRIS
ncbi:MAG: putative hydrolase of the HAD superfamily [Candidatus Azotimanducaceae bacterium]|jgi:putative hydrolase of the HAD superfamily